MRGKILGPDGGDRDDWPMHHWHVAFGYPEGFASPAIRMFLVRRADSCGMPFRVPYPPSRSQRFWRGQAGLGGGYPGDIPPLGPPHRTEIQWYAGYLSRNASQVVDYLLLSLYVDLQEIVLTTEDGPIPKDVSFTQATKDKVVIRLPVSCLRLAILGLNTNGMCDIRPQSTCPLRVLTIHRRPAIQLQWTYIYSSPGLCSPSSLDLL